MGLMKISTYHKILGDEVHFVKGTNPSIDAEVWDRIYVTTLFTFDFAISVETINHYMRLVDDVDSLYVGGIMASLMPDKIIEATGIERSHILTGLFTDTSVVGDHNNINVDQLPLDYDILEETDYEYPAGDNYFAYTTRGCPNHCSFCAVPILEPDFHVTNNIITEEKVKYIADQVYAACKNDGDLLSVKRLKAALKEADSAIENLWVALEKGQSVDMITERIHKREAEKKELEKQLAIEIKKQSGMEYSVILSFLDYLRMLPNDNEYKRRALVNIFINAIYLYDGYFTMILNAGNRPLSIENIPLDDIEKTFENDDVGCSSNSQLVADAPPK